jgi:hypothetical protein
MWIVVVSLVADYQHFEEKYRLHLQVSGEDEDDTFLRNFGNHLQDYMAP